MRACITKLMLHMFLPQGWVGIQPQTENVETQHQQHSKLSELSSSPVTCTQNLKVWLLSISLSDIAWISCIPQTLLKRFRGLPLYNRFHPVILWLCYVNILSKKHCGQAAVMILLSGKTGHSVTQHSFPSSSGWLVSHEFLVRPDS